MFKMQFQGNIRESEQHNLCSNITHEELDMCLWNTDAPGGNKVIIWQKSYILTLPHYQGHVMSVKCEEPIDEPTVPVWLLYHHPNLKYFTLFVSGTELRTDKQTDGQTDRGTDDPITRCPWQTFQAGGIKRRRHMLLLAVTSLIVNCYMYFHADRHNSEVLRGRFGRCPSLG